MKKTIIIFFFLIIYLLTTRKAVAEDATALFKLYGVDRKTDLEKAKAEANKKKNEYENIVKKHAFTDFYNEAVNLADMFAVRELLDEIRPRHMELGQLMSKNIDADLQTILSMETEYIQLGEQIDHLLKVQDSYLEISRIEMPEGNLSEIENDLAEAENTWMNLESVADIGEVESIVQPVQAVYKVISSYGTRINQVNPDLDEFHDGIDLEASEGTGVLSLFNGVVIFSDYDEESGETIKVDHGNGIITTYHHLRDRYVQEGEDVKQYQKIGAAGNTGKSAGSPHLHLGLYINNKSYDPEKLFFGR